RHLLVSGAIIVPMAVANEPTSSPGLSELGRILPDSQIFVDALIQMGAWQDAKHAASTMGQEIRAKALHKLAIAVEQAGEPTQQLWRDAEHAARSIDDLRIRVDALHKVVVALAKASHWIDAEHVACSIDNS